MEKTRQFVIEKTKEINKAAFLKKIIKVKGVNGKRAKVMRTGCNCKSKCDRNYCQCKKNSVGCSSFCRCLECKNKKVIL